MEPESTLEGRIRKQGQMILHLADVVADLGERIGDVLAKQVFTMEELAERWELTARQVRELIAQKRLAVLKTAFGKPRKPLSVYRGEVLRYEREAFCQTPAKPEMANAVLFQPTRKTARGFDPVAASAGFAPMPVGPGVRLGNLDENQSGKDHAGAKVRHLRVRRDR